MATLLLLSATGRTGAHLLRLRFQKAISFVSWCVTAIR
jgi:hypothetical protein